MLSRFANLRIWTSQAVPGLVKAAGDGHVDLELWIQTQPPWLGRLAVEQLWRVSVGVEANGEPAFQVWSGSEPDYFRLRYADGTGFLIDKNGRWVSATWPESSTLEDTATYLLGPVMGLVLHLRGVPCLHASAIAIGDRAIALVGAAGAGKSTTAAAFAQRGYPVLSDDILALARQGSEFFVWPTHPHLRLWPESVELLFDSADALPRITPNWEKRYLDLTGDGFYFQETPLPLAAIYILHGRQASTAAPGVALASGAESLTTLVGHTYAGTLLEPSVRAAEFDFLADLMAAVPVRRVTRHGNPAQVEALCDLILNDFQRLPTPAGAHAHHDNG